MRAYPQKMLTLLAAASVLAAPAVADVSIGDTVDAIVKPLMAEHDVPGMSIAVLRDGERHIFHYGVASRQTGKPVDDKTLFEIGSLSKPFTGTLVADLEAEGQIDLSAKAQVYMPELQGSAIGQASLLHLHTYVAGGLPLQFPEGVDESNVTTFFRDFRPLSATGQSRLYSNASIGLSGQLAADAVGIPFATLVAEKLLEPLQLRDTFFEVPANRMTDYAQGYSRSNEPVRVNLGVYGAQAYGVKTTANDLLRFVEASVNADTLNDEPLKTALAAARTGIYQVRAMHQGMGWELYRAPARLADLLQGADPAFVLEPNDVQWPDVPVTGDAVGTVSKTGSTNGFGAYAVFQPDRGTAIVMLANRFWPTDARINAAHEILSRIDAGFVEDQ
jgi:beta-lactamase class C